MFEPFDTSTLSSHINLWSAIRLIVALIEPEGSQLAGLMISANWSATTKEVVEKHSKRPLHDMRSNFKQAVFAEYRAKSLLLEWLGRDDVYTEGLSAATGLRQQITKAEWGTRNINAWWISKLETPPVYTGREFPPITAITVSRQDLERLCAAETEKAAQNVTASQPQVATSTPLVKPAKPREKKRTGPKPIKRARLAEAMVNNVRSGRATLEQLRNDTGQTLATQYNASRGTAVVARDDALVILTNSSEL